MTSYRYNGLGDRLGQTVDGQTTSYVLDAESGLTQVLAESTDDPAGRLYLYGIRRIGEQHAAGWQYYLGDVLGSLRQMAGEDEAITLARRYAPFGEVGYSQGNRPTPYGFSGEYTDSTGLVFLRARYYAPWQGRFLSRDIWGGEYFRPMSLNRWIYVEGNPLKYVDPSGYILDPSDPTERGTIIHKMIQAQYLELYSFSGHVGIEYNIQFGSTTALKDIIKQQKDPVYDPEQAKKYATGRADIIDFDELGLYEIKPYSGKKLGELTVIWYLAAWNNNAIIDNRPQLSPGNRYPRQPGVIVGTDPEDPKKWITAELYTLGNVTTGVILYGTKNKSNNTSPVPIYIFEWDPGLSTVKRQNSSNEPSGIPSSAPAYSYSSTDGLVDKLGRYCSPLLIPLAVKIGVDLAEYLICGPCFLLVTP